MKRIYLFLFGLCLVASASAQSGPVVMNGSVVSPRVLNHIAQQYNMRLPSGRYWYDKHTGAWGYQGGGTQGFVAPGFNLYADMPENISGGNTGVYINGRHLPQSDVASLRQMLGTVRQGRFWVDAQGNAGYVGGPALFNLRQVAQSRGYYRQGSGVGQNYRGGGSGYRNSNTGIGIITDGQGGAVITD